jgi:nucleotide-binding universal stress UspA family protein
MKTLLIPTDFSSGAQTAIDYAIRLAKDLEAQLVLFHAFHFVPPHATSVPENYIIESFESIRKESAIKLKRMIKKINIDHPELSCSYVVKHGALLDTILDYQNENPIDLIIMGTKGAGAIESFFLGSNAAALIEESAISVLAIPKDALYHGVQNIVYAKDFRTSDIDNLNMITSLFGKLKPEINIVHVSEEDVNIDKIIYDWFKRLILQNVSYSKIKFHTIESENVKAGLTSFVKGQNADLLVMATQKRNFLEKIFNRSLTKQMAYQIPFPLLAMKSN